MSYETTSKTLLPLVLGLTLLTAGCATPDPRPFQQYATAVKTAGDGLDHVLVQDTGWARDKYITSVLDGSASLGRTAFLNRSEPFTVTFPVSGGVTNQPTFYQLQTARVTLLNLNEATLKYINVLATLAGSDLVNPATFATMAQDADASLGSITKQLDAQVPGNAIHVFSVGSTEIARLVIEHKRRQALETILTASQPGIEAYCQKCLTLLLILDQSLANDYSAKAAILEDQYHQLTHGKATEDPKARAVIEQFLQLNSDYLLLVEALKSARKIYAALPEGHRELLKSVRQQPTGFEAISSISEAGKRLASIYQQVSQPAATK